MGLLKAAERIQNRMTNSTQTIAMCLRRDSVTGMVGAGIEASFADRFRIDESASLGLMDIVLRKVGRNYKRRKTQLRKGRKL